LHLATLETSQCESYSRSVNPPWTRPLDAISINVRNTRRDNDDLTTEGVQAAITSSRAHADGAFHDRTSGALPMMGDPFQSRGLGPMLADTATVPSGGRAELECFWTPAATVVKQVHESPSFWTEALGLARRVANI
jgi:hypothetical protein